MLVNNNVSSNGKKGKTELESRIYRDKEQSYRLKIFGVWFLDKDSWHLL